MTCDRLQEQLSAYLDWEVTLAERQAVEEHLAGCAACTRRLETMREMVTALRGLIDVPVPPGLATRVQRRLEKEPAWRRLARLFTPPGMPQGLAVAMMAVVMVMVAAVPLLQPPDLHRRTIDAQRQVARARLARAPSPVSARSIDPSADSADAQAASRGAARPAPSLERALELPPELDIRAADPAEAERRELAKIAAARRAPEPPRASTEPTATDLAPVRPAESAAASYASAMTVALESRDADRFAASRLQKTLQSKPPELPTTTGLALPLSMDRIASIAPAHPCDPPSAGSGSLSIQAQQLRGCREWIREHSEPIRWELAPPDDHWVVASAPREPAIPPPAAIVRPASDRRREAPVRAEEPSTAEESRESPIHPIRLAWSAADRDEAAMALSRWLGPRRSTTRMFVTDDGLVFELPTSEYQSLVTEMRRHGRVATRGFTGPSVWMSGATRARVEITFTDSAP